jgi:AcrR family transcriptional regulator
VTKAAPGRLRNSPTVSGFGLGADAIRVIVRDGLAAASVERIAGEAGTSKGTALYHFGDKEAILAAVVAELYTKGRAAMTERVAVEPDIPRCLRA